MPRKNNKCLTIEEMQTIAKERGGRCISNVYVNNRTKLEWECSEAHRWFCTPDHIKYSKSWCPYCANANKPGVNQFSNYIISINTIKDLAISRRGLCISDEYINCETKMLWQCSEGHQWYRAWNHVKRGSWCPECAGVAKLSIEKMREVAKQNDGYCLSDVYINGKSDIIWKCNKGHIWPAVPQSIIYTGTWCPICAKLPRKTIEDMSVLASKYGGKCLSETYVGGIEKLTWQCKDKHIWNATYASINEGHWCPYCAGNIRKTIEEMHILAANNNGKCLSTEYINADSILEWQCVKGHKWKSRAKNIITGYWCPQCRSTKHENMCRNIFEEIFNKKFPTVRPDWLRKRTKKYKLQLDGYCEELNLAFEFNGPQHYKWVKDFHRTKLHFIEQKIRDRIKQKVCHKNGTKLIIIKYNKSIRYDKQYYKNIILKQLKRFKVSIPQTLSQAA
jgi:hypothetical protein